MGVLDKQTKETSVSTQKEKHGNRILQIRWNMANPSISSVEVEAAKQKAKGGPISRFVSWLHMKLGRSSGTR